MDCLIVCGGEKPDKNILLNYSKNCNFIIGVDKGCNYLAEYNIKADYVVGDFDSSDLSKVQLLIDYGAIADKYNEEKDCTDSEIAFQLAFEKKADKIMFLGATGKRFDHALGNLGLLKKALDKSVKAKIIDDRNKIFLIDKPCVIKNDFKFKYISFLAYNEQVKNFSISNAKYNISEYNLDIGDSRTVSNEFVGQDINVTFDNGIIIVIYSKD